MAKRKKSRSRKGDELRYLVVRGSGDNVYIAVASPPVSDAALARLVDTYNNRKGGRGVVESSRALIIDAESELVRFCGQSLGGTGGPRPK
jgi:hypothetical protein